MIGYICRPTIYHSEVVGEDFSTETPLCVTCGICCGDALFDYRSVTPDEVPGLVELGFPIEQINGGASFRMACVHTAGAVCQVYQDRPATCRAYRCKTLKRLDEGRIDRPEADRRVAMTKEAIANVDKHKQPAEKIHQLRQRLGEMAIPDARLAIALVAYDLLLDRYFRFSDQRMMPEAHRAS